MDFVALERGFGRLLIQRFHEQLSVLASNRPRQVSLEWRIWEDVDVSADAVDPHHLITAMEHLQDLDCIALSFRGMFHAEYQFLVAELSRPILPTLSVCRSGSEFVYGFFFYIQSFCSLDSSFMPLPSPVILHCFQLAAQGCGLYGLQQLSLVSRVGLEVARPHMWRSLSLSTDARMTGILNCNPIIASHVRILTISPSSLPSLRECMPFFSSVHEVFIYASSLPPLEPWLWSYMERAVSITSLHISGTLSPVLDRLGSASPNPFSGDIDRPAFVRVLPFYRLEYNGGSLQCMLEFYLPNLTHLALPYDSCTSPYFPALLESAPALEVLTVSYTCKYPLNPKHLLLIHVVLSGPSESSAGVPDSDLSDHLHALFRLISDRSSKSPYALTLHWRHSVGYLNPSDRREARLHALQVLDALVVLRRLSLLSFGVPRDIIPADELLSLGVVLTHWRYIARVFRLESIDQAEGDRSHEVYYFCEQADVSSIPPRDDQSSFYDQRRLGGVYRWRDTFVIA
ncbi:hypothetical protein CVT26_011707 [Gymnopilus dilepis]|uniref:Uncharacterized protein n=1 Tax=Gymnopilus dilepis TaxID=231916 RepID=A0A409YH58_9AGAR|nr:hypothetical protein CVT26_011707 [Gymnopilus dilepis]